MSRRRDLLATLGAASASGSRLLDRPSIAAMRKQAAFLTIDFGALGHSDIRIKAINAAGEVAEDYFHVRVAGENAYTIAKRGADAGGVGVAYLQRPNHRFAYSSMATITSDAFTTA
jgi:hypothetical protein